jgi:multidrug efflux pump subunit AcrA (membrane-fusion protein)
VLLIGGAAAATYPLFGKNMRSARPDLVTHTVGRERLTLTIVERGALESADNNELTCRVKAGTKNSTVATTIKWVLDDGSHVKKGDLVVDLDDSGLQEQLKTQKITLDGAESNKIQAEENYKIVISQNESDLKTAEIAIQLAELDLRKYLEGEYPQALKDVDGRISMAQSDLEMQRDRSAWSLRMVKKGYQTSSQAQAEQSKLDGYDLTLRKLNEEKRVLTRYTKERTETDLTSKVAEAKRALERIKSQASAKEVQARTDRETKKSIYEQEKRRFEEIEEEIRKCKIFAPQDGMVVYVIPEQSRFGSGTQQSIVAQGEPVREGQKLIRIPDLHHMLVNTKVHEALVSRVRGEVTQPTGFVDSVRAVIGTTPNGLSRIFGMYAMTEMRDKFREEELNVLYPGHEAIVRIDAFPERVLKGHVKSVATVASQADWMAADVKTYQTMVAIDEQLDNLKPGMSAEVTIMAEKTAEPVLTVPVQAIIGTATLGAERKCFVLAADGSIQERDIVVGMSNEKMAEVRSGLQEDEKVVLNPPRSVLGDRRMRSPDAGRSDTEDTPSKGKGKGKRGMGPGGPDDMKGGPGAAPGGPGAGGPGGQAAMNPEEIQKKRQELFDRMSKASPEQRKQILQQIPEAYREKTREDLKTKGVVIPD